MKLEGVISCGDNLHRSLAFPLKEVGDGIFKGKDSETYSQI